MKSLHIRLKKEQIEKLTEVSKRTDEDISKILRRAVDVYLEDFFDYVEGMETLSAPEGEFVDGEEVRIEFEA